MKRTEIERLLPGVFQRTLRPGNPLSAILDVMEGLHAPSEGQLESLDAVFDPRRTPDKFVSFLARWLDLERLFDKPARGQPQTSALPIPTGLGRLRELTAAAAHLSQWRGTAHGLLLFLRTATGHPGFAVEEQVEGVDDKTRPFHIRVRAPGEMFPYRGLIQRIIELEKPAYVTYELLFEAGTED
jgi:phage tail-like protein